MARKENDTKKKTKKAKKPKGESRLHQFKEVFKLVYKNDPATIWISLGILVVTFIAVFFVVNYFFNWFTGIIVGLPIAFLAALIFFSRRAEKAMYRQVEDQPGVVGYILTNLGRGWNSSDEPVAYNRNQDLVFRTIGRPGVVLVSQGPHSRVASLLKSEQKRLSRILPNVPIHTIEAGKQEGQTPVTDLTKKIRKLPKAISQQEISAINARISSLGNKKPVPKGVDPMKSRPDRKAMRGR